MDELIEDVLDKIHVAKAFNSNHQMLLAEKAKELASEHEESEYPVRLLAIDSLTAHFRAEYVGRGELADRQQKLNKHLHDLDKVGNLYNAAVLVTNQVASNPDSFSAIRPSRSVVTSSVTSPRSVSTSASPKVTSGSSGWSTRRTSPTGRPLCVSRMAA